MSNVRPIIDGKKASEGFSLPVYEVGNSDESPLPSAPSVEVLADFDAFWVLYPRHVAKLAARKAWAKVRPADHIAILEALVAWRQVWRDKDPEYLPHGATWLNGERWEDELPQGYSKVTAESPQTAQIASVGADRVVGLRQAIPAHIQAVINRITGKKKPV